MLFLALVLTFVNGWYVLEKIWPVSPDIDSAERWLRRSLALGVGLFVQTLLGYASLLVTDSVQWGLLGEIGIAALAIVDWRRRRVLGEHGSTSSSSGWLASLAIALLVVDVIASFGLAVRRWSQAPLGYHDSVSHWTVRGLFLTANDSSWRTILSPHQFQAEYPLLVPLAIARFLAWTGMENPSLFAPLVVSLVYALGIVGVLTAGLTAVRDRFVGGIAGLVLLGFPLFLCWTIALNADVQVLFFFVATFAVWCWLPRIPDLRPRLLFLVGVLFAGAAWSKNEGVVFAAVSFATMAVVFALQHGVRAAFRDLAWVSLGLMLFAAPIVQFKLMVPPQNDFVAGWARQSPLEQLIDPARWRMIARAARFVVVEFVQLWMIAVVALLFLGRGLRRPSGEEWCCPVVTILLFAAYWSAYLATPHDLVWHIGCSVDRLFLHLLPLFVWSGFLFLRPATSQDPVPFWRSATLALALLVSGWGTVRAIRELPEYPWPPTWREIHREMIDYRFAELRDYVPRGEAIRYVDPTRAGDGNRHLSFYVARQVLAPRVLEPNLDADWVLAFHPRADDVAPFAATERLALIKNLDNGFRLFRRVSPDDDKGKQ